VTLRRILSWSAAVMGFVLLRALGAVAFLVWACLRGPGFGGG